MITLLTGAPGHGKSYTLVREIEQSVVKGIPVATNVPLRDDWAEVMAKRHTAFGILRHKAVARKAIKFRTHVFISDDLKELTRVRLHGEGEGRGKLVLDESGRKLDPRGWDTEVDRETGDMVKRPVAVANRKRILDWFAGHRHFGFDCLVAVQDIRNIDTRLTSLYEFHSEVRNFKRLPWFSIIFRFNFFVRRTYWNDRSRSKAGFSCYWLSKSLARLYHTHGLALVDLDLEGDPIMLPADHPIPATKGKLPTIPGDPLLIGLVYRMPTGELITRKYEHYSGERMLPV